MVIQFNDKERCKALKNKILTSGMRLFFNNRLISAYCKKKLSFVEG